MRVCNGWFWECHFCRHEFAGKFNLWPVPVVNLKQQQKLGLANWF